MARVRLRILIGTLVTLVLSGSSLAPSHAEDAGSAVPAPSGVAILDVSAGKVYPFPWSGVNACSTVRQPGCFLVEAVDDARAVLVYPRFEIDRGTRKALGVRFRTPVTRDGSGYELFPIALGRGREEWVYALLEPASAPVARVRFLKLPAFVTSRARLSVRIDLDLPGQALEERYTVEAHEPVTLLGLGNVDALFHGARLAGVAVDGQPVAFPHAAILHLNVPAGRHEVAVSVRLGAPPSDVTIQGTLLEPRNMALIQDVDLRVDLGAERRAALELRAIGAPQEAWDRFRAGVGLMPSPTAEETAPLAVRYRFEPSRYVSIRTHARVAAGPFNYPATIRLLVAEPKGQ